MKALLKRLVVYLVTIVLGTYLGVGALLWSLQESMLFPVPGGIDRAMLDGAAREIGARPIDLVSSDGVRLYGWHRRAEGKRALIYLHGNGETVADSMAMQRLAWQEGWDFATVAWRGYPGSEGKPSEDGLIRDARALWDHVVGLGIAPEHVVVHGRSLGGGIAAALATEVQPGGVVIESSFSSILEIAEAEWPMYPVRWLLRNPLESRLRAPKVTAPVLILHGDADTLVPVDHARRMSKLYPNARYVEIADRGHNDSLVIGSREGRAAWLDLLSSVAAGGAP